MSAPVAAAPRFERLRPQRAALRLDRTLQAVAVLTLLAALLRFPTLDLQSYWFDETVTTMDTLQPSLLETLKDLHYNELAPPLYPTLAWFWSQVFGKGEVGMRSLSALIGTAIVPAAYAAATELVSRRAGLAAAALAATHPLLVWYSQEARVYILLLLLTTLSLLFFSRALRDPSPRNLTTWAGVAALMFWSHYFALYLVLGQAVWLVLAVRGTDAWRRTTVALGGLAAAGALVLPLALQQRGTGGGNWIAENYAFGDRLLDFPIRYLVWWLPWEVEAWLRASFWVWAVPLTLLACWQLLTRTDEKEQPGVRALLTLGVVALALPLLMALAGQDYFHARHLMASFPPVLLLMAAGFGTQRAGRLGVAGAAVICAVFLAINVEIWTDEDNHRDDWRTTAQELGTPRTERVVVVAPWWSYEPLRMYGHPVDTLGERPARVREILIVGERAHMPGPGVVPALGFVRQSTRVVQRLAIVRFAAKRPRTVTAAEIGRRLGTEPAAVRLEPPRG